MAETIYPDEIKSAIIEGKNPDRVHKGYIQFPKDWKAQYDMLLRDGLTCSDCRHCERCVLMFDQKATDTSCQFYPSRFQQKQPVQP